MNNSDNKQNTMVPKLRFPEFFKHNKNWKKKILKHYLKESRILGSKGNIAKKITVKLWGKGVYEKEEYIQGSPNTQYYIRKSGQFIYSKLDFLNQAFGIIPVHLNGYESTVDLPCFDISNELNNKFLLEYIQRDDFYKKFGEIADGGRVAKRIQVGTFLSFSILLPELEEQQKIADCLSSVDDLILAQEKKIDLLQKHKNGMLQQLFTADGGSVPKIRFKEFVNTVNWCQIKLIDTADKNIKWSLIGGPFGSNLKTIDYVERGVRVIQLQNIGDAEFIDNYEVYTSEEKANQLLSSNIYPGDIILSKMGEPVGRACLIPNLQSRYVMCSDGIRLVVDSKLFSKYFIFSLINSPPFRKSIEKAATGSTRKRIGLDDLKKLIMQVPKSIKEQQKIADCLSSLDELISLEIKKLELFKIHKKGLMQQLFPSMDEVS